MNNQMLVDFNNLKTRVFTRFGITLNVHVWLNLSLALVPIALNLIQLNNTVD